MSENIHKTKTRELPSAQPPKPMYVSYANESDLASTLSNSSKEYTLTTARMDYRNILPNVDVRPGFNRRDYETFRPERAIPYKTKDIISMCMQAYNQVGIVRHIIDLMGDFACQGIKIVHNNPEIEKYFKAWFQKVMAKDRSERILNTIYRCGNVVIRRETAKLTESQHEALKKGLAADVEYIPLPKQPRNEIPIRYTLYDPLSVEMLGDKLSTFVGQKVVALKIPEAIRRQIANPTGAERELVAQLPEDVIRAVRENNGYLVLPADKVSVYHYKKDDWDVWANPMIYAVLDDIMTLEQLRLADRAALDGAISNIRVWKLGNLENKIIPTDAAVSKLAGLLSNNTGVGTLDLIWGPDIELIESNTNVHQFLGNEKYIPTLNAIYAGLGVPPTMTGAATQGGFTNNFISVKTLIEKLQYGRDILIDFWNKEIKLVQQAKGFRFPAYIQFDRMTLSDEAAEKNLLIQLADRNIISYETIRERFGEFPELESVRVRREERDREKEKMPPKADPFHNGNVENELKKIALQGGSVSPSEVGLELEEKKSGETSLMDKQAKIAKLSKPAPSLLKTTKKPKGKSGQGRPKNKKDSGKRKQKRVLPRSKASLGEFPAILMWAQNAQKTISEIITPGLLKVYEKKNLRQLTDEQFKEAEQIKFNILCAYEPFQPIDNDTVKSNLAYIPEDDILSSAQRAIAQFKDKVGRELTIDEIRNIQVNIFSLYLVGDEDGEN